MPGICHSGPHRQILGRVIMIALPGKVGLFASILVAALLITLVVAINALFSVAAI